MQEIVTSGEDHNLSVLLRGEPKALRDWIER